MGPRFAPTALLALTLALLPACDRKENAASAAPAPEPPPPAATAHVESFGEFEFVVPKGWVRGKPPRDKTKAVLWLEGTDGKPKAMLMVDVGTPVRPTASDSARALTGKEPKPTKIGGLDGARAEGDSTDLQKPRHVAVVLRDSRAFLIMASSQDGLNITPEFEQAISTWKWSAAPAK